MKKKSKTAARPKWLTKEDSDVYHGKTGEYLSSHMLAEFRKCPYLYWKKHSGLIADRDSGSFAFGRAAHTLILEGRKTFEAEYAIGGPINPRTGKPYGSSTKAYAGWLVESGKNSAVTDNELVVLEMMQNAVMTHPIAPALITGGWAEGVIRKKQREVRCQSRLDYFHPKYGLVDLKTCDDLAWFKSDARRFGYVHQLAFYSEMLRLASGKEHEVHIIAVEKKEPYRTGVWRISKGALEFAKTENEMAIERLKVCINTQVWPTGFEDVRIFDTL